MPAPKPTAKQRADLGPIPALYGRANPSTFGPGDDRYHYSTAADGAKTLSDAQPLPAWTPDGWTRHYSCAITGPCLTGEHLRTEPAEEVAV